MTTTQAPEPTATLDARYSDDNAAATDWRVTERRLAEAQLCWLVTVRTDGRPHATPAVPVWHAGRAYFHTGGREQKHANLLSNPRVLVLVGDDRWDGGLDVVLEGAASRITDESVLRTVAALYAKRWDGRWRLDVRDGAFANPAFAGLGSLVFEVTPTRAYAHAKGTPFSHTSYRF